MLPFGISYTVSHYQAYDISVNPEPNADLNLAPAGSFHGTDDLVEKF